MPSGEWPGEDTWLCDGCSEPQPRDRVWPCQTSSGRQCLCEACREARDVDPIVLPDSGRRWSA
ncbi:hypothetical protein J2752_000496 [Halarchaeum rubridurum]|uniref:Uncharacterized protein n=1 Tax=Halarchaeum rubridurum TaxID=489911 RepID=A0A8T4GKB6_9EURY|nr:hypothetical protein [Halarchaeum rubridurum]